MTFPDCYIGILSTQMELLKLIKYSTFEVSVLNGIVDENGLLKEKMNISGTDFIKLLDYV